MARTKIEKFGRAFEFATVGDEMTGRLEKITNGETKFGQAEFMQFTLANGELVSVCMSASLQGLDWAERVGDIITLVYTGLANNPKTKRDYKTFDMFVEDGEI
jgi:hypothetical protein